ncbi:Aste57867_16852 [Aphanomyces stellatus]|uniref:Aste57867_16852 protein n=1 Tax=Aphanomyces stellatus TaxID=120398 RepID=A0A485L6I6_9STRA|nr:hypothetical protein As57867_016794 [Aphanomyces stellatus]VFT93616.1 Aste57867_16852 [Aphanomyces stellatus]
MSPMQDSSSPCLEFASPTHVEALFEVDAPRVVQFTTATTFLFNVAYGGSALPKESGPPVGMAITHFDVHEEDLRVPRSHRGCRVRKFNHLERIALLKRAEYHVQEIAAFCMDAIDVRKSRANTLKELAAEKKELRKRKRMAAATDAIDAAPSPTKIQKRVDWSAADEDGATHLHAC